MYSPVRTSSGCKLPPPPFPPLTPTFGFKANLLTLIMYFPVRTSSGCKPPPPPPPSPPLTPTFGFKANLLSLTMYSPVRTFSGCKLPLSLTLASHKHKDSQSSGEMFQFIRNSKSRMTSARIVVNI